LDACGLRSQAARTLLALDAADERLASLARGPYLRAARIAGTSTRHPVTDFVTNNTGQNPTPGWRREKFPILVSIHIQTNNPDNFTTFCDRIANSCDDPSRIEVIVKIDDDHEALNELLPIEVARQPFQLKYISTPLIG